MLDSRDSGVSTSEPTKVQEEPKGQDPDFENFNDVDDLPF